jgi:hypothetical protein
MHVPSRGRRLSSAPARHTSHLWRHTRQASRRTTVRRPSRDDALTTTRRMFLGPDAGGRENTQRNRTDLLLLGFRWSAAYPFHHFREGAGRACTTHQGKKVPVFGRDSLVLAWYRGGVDTVNFTSPRNARKIEYIDFFPTAEEDSDNWSQHGDERNPKPGTGLITYGQDGQGGHQQADRPADFSSQIREMVIP